MPTSQPLVDPLPDRSRGRRRPALHLTPPQGWLNDAYGIVHVGGRYHLFHQHVPDSTAWAPGVHWAHAVSPDLVAWEHQGSVLTPDERDSGCWSGSVAVEDGRATLFYTAVREPSLSLGTVRRAPASADLLSAVKDAGPPIIEPPAGLDVVEFRDPFVWRDHDGWKAVLGCGTGDGGGAIVQYSQEPDGSWHQVGVLLSAHPDDEVWTGSVWECPQFFPLGESWVLLISVWHDQRLHHVVAAIGELDGGRFVPRRWQRLDHGPVAYATTAFLDRDGRRCVLSWLRQEPDPDTPWTGALGLPYVLHLDGDRLRAELHLDLLAYRGAAVPLGAQPVLLSLVGSAIELDVARSIAAEGVTRVLVTTPQAGPASARLLEISWAPGGHELVVEAAGLAGAIRVPIRVPSGDGDAEQRLRVVLDADIVEIVDPDGGPITLRLPDAPREVQVSVHVADGDAGPDPVAWPLRSPWAAAG